MRFILGVVLSAVALFFWGFVFWTLSPYPMSVISTLPDEPTVAAALRDTGTETGVYMIPGGDPTDETVAARHEQGPIAMLMVQAEGATPMESSVFIKGFLHMLGSSFLLAIILSTAGRRTYFGRFMLCIWIGLFVGIWAEMSNVIWFYFPLRYACLQQTYHLSSLLVMGAVLSFFITPPGEGEQD